MITVLISQLYWIGVRMMNKKSIKQAKNPLLFKALPALERAAKRARRIASQTGTKVIIMQDGHKQRISIGGVHEPSVDYQGAKNKRNDE